MSEASGAFVPREGLRRTIKERLSAPRELITDIFSGISVGVIAGQDLRDPFTIISELQHEGPIPAATERDDRARYLLSSLGVEGGDAEEFIKKAKAGRLGTSEEAAHTIEYPQPGQKPNSLSLGQLAQVGRHREETAERDRVDWGIDDYYALDVTQKDAYGALRALGLPHESALKSASGEWPAVLDGNVWVEAFDL